MWYLWHTFRSYQTPSTPRHPYNMNLWNIRNNPTSCFSHPVSSLSSFACSGGRSRLCICHLWAMLVYVWNPMRSVLLMRLFHLRDCSTKLSVIQKWFFIWMPNSCGNILMVRNSNYTSRFVVLVVLCCRLDLVSSVIIDTYTYYGFALASDRLPPQECILRPWFWLGCILGGVYCVV